MKFYNNHNKKIYSYLPIYDVGEQSFTTDIVTCSNFTIMVRGVYTGLDVCLKTNTLVSVAGYNPQKKWIKVALKFPKAIQGQVIVDFENVEVYEGTCVDYAESWNTYYDPKNGVVCIGNPQLEEKCENIMFTKNIAVSLLNEKLKAIWLKPKFV